MPTRYILNSIKCLRRRQRELVDAIGSDAEQAEEYLIMAEKILELTNELLHRKKKHLDEKGKTDMAIGEYKDLECQCCSQKGFIGRDKVETIGEEVIWWWKCSFCGVMNKVKHISVKGEE